MRDGTEPFVETELVIPRVADADRLAGANRIETGLDPHAA